MIILVVIGGIGGAVYLGKDEEQAFHFAVESQKASIRLIYDRITLSLSIKNRFG